MDTDSVLPGETVSDDFEVGILANGDTPTNTPPQRHLLTPSHSCDKSINEDVSPTHSQGFPPSPVLSPSSSLRPYQQSIQALKEVLLKEGPCPMIIKPPCGGYWVQNGEFESSQGEDGIWRAPEISTDHFRVDVDNTALMYGRHFACKKHQNYILKESNVGPLLLSWMAEGEAGCGEPPVRMILRTQKETLYKVFSYTQLPLKLKPEDYLSVMASMLRESPGQLKIEGLMEVQAEKAPVLIQKFDEHSVARQHKFGVIFQRSGQTSEEEMFSNNDHPPSLEEFLELLGDKITLNGFTGYRGGLDCKKNQTGEHSVYTKFNGQEIMFHISTMLPFDPCDPQQVARKRHIGNDIVAIVFQESNTPFSPDLIRSKFLHSFIVVQVEHPNSENTVYKVGVTAKDDVPDFSPPLPNPAVFSKDADFRDWLLTKLLNAESKCYHASSFLKLATRTRTQLFNQLIAELTPTIDPPDATAEKRKSFTLFDIPNDVLNGNSPRRRRKTFGAMFPMSKRKSLLSPKISSNSASNIAAQSYNNITASTPDLSIIGEEIMEGPSGSTSRSQTLGSVTRYSSFLRPDSADKPKKSLFTKGKKAKKSKRRSLTTNVVDLENLLGSQSSPAQNVHQKEASSKQSVSFDESSEDRTSSVDLNWSVPDLTVQSPSQTSQSVNNLIFSPSASLNTTNLVQMCCASNPDLLSDSAHEHFYRRLVLRNKARRSVQIPETFKKPVSMPESGPHTCDVAVQVEPGSRVFRFPTPPDSLPFRSGSPSHSSSESKNSRIPVQTDRKGNKKGAAGKRFLWKSKKSSSTETFSPQSQSLSLEEVKPEVAKPVLQSDGKVANQVLFAVGSSDSSDEEDNVNDTLVKSLASLTEEVARQREHQLLLYRQNARLAARMNKWKRKYELACQQLQVQNTLIQTLQQQISEEGTFL